MIKIKTKFNNNLKKDLAKIVKKDRVAIENKLLNNLKNATPIDTGEAKAGWVKETNGDVTKIINNVDHISILNKGNSKQAPALFIEKTCLSTEGVLENGIIVSYKQ
jgi:hypothetical protein